MTIGPSTSTPQQRKNWTVLVWAASDNNLYPYEINDLDKMERVGPSSAMNLLATIDHAPNPDPKGPHSMQRLEIQKDDKPGLNSIVRGQEASGNMADPKALADFIKWGVKNYPAEHYWLVVSDHGDAWQGACEDESHQSWMSLPGIQSALFEARQDTGKKLDVVSFDCCYMASTEVAHQLQGEARYLVASQEEMGFKGLDYDNLLPEAAHLAPKQLAQRLVSISGKDADDIQTYSAIDLERMPAVSAAFSDLSQAIVHSPKSGSELRQAAESSEAFWNYRDAYDLADKLGNSDPTLKAAADRVKSTLGEAVLAERHADNHPRAHGLQIEINPDTAEAGIHRGHNREDKPLKTDLGGYMDTAFARDTGWGEAIVKLNS